MSGCSKNSAVLKEVNDIFTYEQVAWAVLVIIAFFSVVSIVGKGVDYLKAWRKPHDDVVRKLNDHDVMLAKDKRRIDSMEVALNLGLKAQMQLLQHGIHGNHTDAMQETYDEIQQYLINR